MSPLSGPVPDPSDITMRTNCASIGESATVTVCLPPVPVNSPAGKSFQFAVGCAGWIASLLPAQYWTLNFFAYASPQLIVMSCTGFA